MAHLVSKEIFLNLKPGGSNIQTTAPEYFGRIQHTGGILEQTGCVLKSLRWRAVSLEKWSCVVGGGILGSQVSGSRNPVRFVHRKC